MKKVLKFLSVTTLLAGAVYLGKLIYDEKHGKYIKSYHKQEDTEDNCIIDPDIEKEDISKDYSDSTKNTLVQHFSDVLNGKIESAKHTETPVDTHNDTEDVHDDVTKDDLSNINSMEDAVDIEADFADDTKNDVENSDEEFLDEDEENSDEEYQFTTLDDESNDDHVAEDDSKNVTVETLFDDESTEEHDEEDDITADSKITEDTATVVDEQSEE